MTQSFAFYSLTNPRMHAAKYKSDEYDRYLQRIQKIVDRKSHQDKSTSMYIKFLHRNHEIARQHTSLQNMQTINVTNQNLLNRILNVKNRENHTISKMSYHVAYHQKRFREQRKINEENKKIMKRVILQPPKVSLPRAKSQETIDQSRKPFEKTFCESRLLMRKLPKLIKMRS